MTKKKKKNKHNTNLHNYARYSSMAFQMMAVIIVGVWGGVKLDEWLRIGFPVFTILLSFVSVGGAVYIGIKDFINTKQNDK
ncbi:MAG: AtpZ/AtpI family protein [Bacteroidales bacterium]